MLPVLEFKGIERIWFTPKNTNLKYIAQRIIVVNSGRSAAKNCKGYVIYKEGVIERKERVCWMVPKERPNATINRNDNERLDFCAFLDKTYATNVRPVIGGIVSIIDHHKECEVIAPTEEGFDLLDFRSLTGVVECKVLVPAGNADPIEAEIKIDSVNSQIEILFSN